MIDDRDAGVAFERGDISGSDHARHRHQLAAFAAEQVVVMRVLQLEPCAAVIEHDLADRLLGHELLDRAEHRGEIRGDIEFRLQILKRPGVMMALSHQREDRIGDDGLAGHTGGA